MRDTSNQAIPEANNISASDSPTGGTSSDYWVDLSTDGEHGYTWGHGGALPLDSGLWNPGKPDIPGTGGEEMCAGLLNANGRVVGLDDHHCSRMSNYICKVIAT